MRQKKEPELAREERDGHGPKRLVKLDGEQIHVG
jgi:hypothetical protein